VPKQHSRGARTGSVVSASKAIAICAAWGTRRIRYAGRIRTAASDPKESVGVVAQNLTELAAKLSAGRG
jgi:hypothetical protein